MENAVECLVVYQKSNRGLTWVASEYLDTMMNSKIVAPKCEQCFFKPAASICTKFT